MFKQALDAPTAGIDPRGPRNEDSKRPHGVHQDSNHSDETRRRPHRRLDGEYRGHTKSAPFPGQSSTPGQFVGIPRDRSNAELEIGAQGYVSTHAQTSTGEHAEGPIGQDPGVVIGGRNDLKGTLGSIDWLGMYSELKESRRQQLLTAAQSTIEIAKSRALETDSARPPVRQPHNKGVGLEKTVTFASKTAQDASIAAQLNARANIEQGVVSSKPEAYLPSVNASGGGCFSVNILA